jgi:hypothetical protein
MLKKSAFISNLFTKEINNKKDNDFVPYKVIGKTIQSLLGDFITHKYTDPMFEKYTIENVIF